MGRGRYTGFKVTGMIKWARCNMVFNKPVIEDHVASCPCPVIYDRSL